MKIKWVIIAAILALIFLAKKKNDKVKAAQKIEEALKSNEISSAEQLDLIRLKLEDWLTANYPINEQNEITSIVLKITTNLEDYKKQLEEDYA